MVNLFRRMVAVRGIVEELTPLAGEDAIRYLWLQLHVCDEESATRARSAGLEVIMDRCLNTEHRRLMGRCRPALTGFPEAE